MSPLEATASARMAAPPVPWWARPSGVALAVAAYLLVFAALTLGLASALGVDAAIENYFVQSLALSYNPRNPPLFDWLQFAVERWLGPGLATMAAMRYGLMFAGAMMLYAVARKAIADPRLQALAVFSLSLLWVVGYHAHRIITHSHVMVIGIGGTLLAVLLLRERRTAARYGWLGLSILVGMLGKYGFAAFLAALVPALLADRAARAVLSDRRIAIALTVAGAPLAAFLLAVRAMDQDVAATLGTLVTARATWGEALLQFASAWIGYLIPFLPIFLLVFAVRPRKRDPVEADPRAPIRRLLLILLATGTAMTVVWVLASGTANIRDRYLHVFLLPATVYAFALADTWIVRQGQVRAFLGILIATAAAIGAVYVAVYAIPDPRLCGQCRGSVPYPALGRALMARLGSSPTLVAPDTYTAGQLRMAVPGSRVVLAHPSSYRPPASAAAATCALVWTDDAPAPGEFPHLADTNLASADKIATPWWTPLPWPRGGRVSTWLLLPLPSGHPACR